MVLPVPNNISPAALNGLTPLQPIRPFSGAPAEGAGGVTGSAVPFADILGQALSDVSATQAAATDDPYDLLLGGNADLHSVMIRGAMETAAVETAVELTSRAVSVYKEIMQMQI